MSTEPPLRCLVLSSTGSLGRVRTRCLLVTELAQLEISLGARPSSDSDSDSELLDDVERGIEEILTSLYFPSSPTLLQHLSLPSSRPLRRMFPSICEYLGLSLDDDHDDLDDDLDGTSPCPTTSVLDEYLVSVGELCQVQRTCLQILRDLGVVGGERKYLAHQLAMLYQFLTQVLPRPHAKELKSRIGERFSQLKDLRVQSGSSEEDTVAWLKVLIADILSEIRRISPRFLCRLAPVWRTVLLG